MLWARTTRADAAVCALADRHYPPRKRGSRQVGPPASLLVLRTVAGDAAWVTAWPQYRLHDHGDVWMNTLFRSESPFLASDLIRAACAASVAHFGEVRPVLTYVDPAQVREKRDPGYCFLRAGFDLVGRTRGGHGRPPLLEFLLPAELLPAPVAALRLQLALEVAAA
jgi:hypothetical protein